MSDDGLTWLGRKWQGWQWRRTEGKAASNYRARMGHNDPPEVRAERIRDAAPLAGTITPSRLVEVVEATPEEWAVIQRRLDEEDAAHALEHRMAARNLGESPRGKAAR